MTSRPTKKALLGFINRHERRSQLKIELPLKVNIETESELKVVFVGAKLNRNLKNQLITLLNKFKEIFTWSYKDMPNLITNIMVHHLPI